MDQGRIDNIKKEIVESMASEDNPGQIMILLEELFTESEVKDLCMRWELMKLLLRGKSQRVVADELGLSLCKITRGAKILKNERSAVKRNLEKILSKEQQGDC